MISKSLFFVCVLFLPSKFSAHGSMGLCGVHEGKRSESRLFLLLLCAFSSYANDFIESVGKTGELGNSQVA